MLAARRTGLALSLLGLAAALIACGSETVALPATAEAVPTAALPELYPTREPLAPPASQPAAPPPAPTPPLEPTAAALAVYRAWMEEARALHPYAESVEAMWAVMLCESSGNAAVVAGAHHGLFQYSAATWGGAWNPYRDQPILDPRAQIFATAKAWQDGYQSWWGCY